MFSDKTELSDEQMAAESLKWEEYGHFTEAHSELYQTSKMEHLAKMVNVFFRETLHLRCLTGFCIHLSPSSINVRFIPLINPLVPDVH